MAGGLYWLFSGAVLLSPVQPTWLIGAGVAGAFYLVAVASMDPPEAACDYVDKQVSNRRERVAQAAALLLSLAFVAFQGKTGLIGQLPLWSAMVGVAAFQIARKLSD